MGEFIHNKNYTEDEINEFIRHLSEITYYAGDALSFLINHREAISNYNQELDYVAEYIMSSQHFAKNSLYLYLTLLFDTTAGSVNLLDLLKLSEKNKEFFYFLDHFEFKELEQEIMEIDDDEVRLKEMGDLYTKRLYKGKDLLTMTIFESDKHLDLSIFKNDKIQCQGLWLTEDEYLMSIDDYFEYFIKKCSFYYKKNNILYRLKQVRNNKIAHSSSKTIIDKEKYSLDNITEEEINEIYLFAANAVQFLKATSRKYNLTNEGDCRGPINNRNFLDNYRQSPLMLAEYLNSLQK